ncbi:DUF6249 domain-containing protein [Brevundimonas sp.]
MGVEILIPLAGIAMIIAIVVGPAWLKSRERREMQAVFRAAVEKGQPLPPELIDAMTKDQVRKLPSASRDLRIGVILLALSAGVAAAFLAIGFGVDNDAKFVAGFAAIPGAIGLAFIILSFFNKNKD